ncbi:hypothetical protein [Gordonia sp. (in: high G+C Gram-positive bacteria)]|uniref:hypothetical protein n=1 Tax=Gordonia sp. (in: high G+C Gram-positive bacteria) TaxID=84139 RepID=UPI003F94D10D
MSTNDESQAADAPQRKPQWEESPSAPLINGLKYGTCGLGILIVVGLLVWWPFKGMPGLWGALIGAAIGGSFILITVIAILLTSKASPSAVMAALMGSYLVKVVIVIGVTATIKNMDFYNKPALVSVLIGAIVLVLGGELWGVMSTRTTYVDPDETTGQ